MYVIVGLGNFGEKYEHTRHNAGVDSLTLLAGRNQIKVNKHKFLSLIGEGWIEGKKCVLAFPQTYMNASGDAVSQLVQFYKPAPDELIVLYDDVDLDEGAIRVRAAGGPGTHNGMRSIVSALDSGCFCRVRVGIGKNSPETDIADYVLSKIPREKWDLMFDAYTQCAMAVEEIIKNGVQSAMARFNNHKKAEKTNATPSA